MSELTPEHETKIRERLASANPLPWALVPRDDKDMGDYFDLHGGPVSDHPAEWWLDEIVTHAPGDHGVPLSSANARFLCHAREDVPALLAEIDRLRTELESQRAYEKRLREQHDADVQELRRLRDELEEARTAVEYSSERADVWEEEHGAAFSESDRLHARVTELEKAAVEGRAALANLIDDHEDPGTAALGALWLLLNQATLAVKAQPDQGADVLARHDAEVLHQAAPKLAAICEQYGIFGVDTRLCELADEARRTADRDPYADSPDAGITEACDCHGASHAMQQHCVDWPCPSICSPEPGVEHA
jgi:hypothetical protein